MPKSNMTIDPRSLEACQQRGFPGLTDDEIDLDSDVLQIIKANSDFITQAIVDSIQSRSKAGQELLTLLRSVQ